MYFLCNGNCSEEYHGQCINKSGYNRGEVAWLSNGALIAKSIASERATIGRCAAGDIKIC